MGAVLVPNSRTRRRANQGRRFKAAFLLWDEKYTRGRRIAYELVAGSSSNTLNLTDDEGQQ